jgi:hypothetical protein
MPRGHQITANILPSPDQVPRRFLLDARNRDRDDLTQVQQPGQMPGIALDAPMDVKPTKPVVWARFGV